MARTDGSHGMSRVWDPVRSHHLRRLGKLRPRREDVFAIHAELLCGGLRSHGTVALWLVFPARHHPKSRDARGLVGQGDGREFGRFASEQRGEPAQACPLARPAAEHGGRPDHQKVRKVASPTREITPSRAFPPLECSFGVSPIHAAKSRPELKPAEPAPSSAAGRPIGPMPGISVRRRLSALFSRRTISLATSCASEPSPAASSFPSAAISSFAGTGSESSVAIAYELRPYLRHALRRDHPKLRRMGAQRVDRQGARRTSRSRAPAYRGLLFGASSGQNTSPAGSWPRRWLRHRSHRSCRASHKA